MLATCEHCGYRNDVPDSAANTEVVCQKCAQRFFALSDAELAANRRATTLLVAAIVLFFAIIALLLFSHSKARAVETARAVLVGGGLAGKLGGGGGGNGEAGGTGNGEGRDGSSGSELHDNSLNDGLPDPLATNQNRSPDASIGRPSRNVGQRKPGDEVRAGAAGNDDPAATIGNSRTGQPTNAPSAGANPGNSDRRNNVETPEGDEPLTGSGAGGDAASGALSSTNSRSTALLLDDFSERLRQAGARSGDVQVSLEWKNINDLDLHVIDPRGERIFYNHRDSQSGGHLDVDMNAGGSYSARPVENIYWPERGAPKGLYRVEVMHFANHGARDPTQFTVRVINKGQSSYYRGYVTYTQTANRNYVAVCTFTLQ